MKEKEKNIFKSSAKMSIVTSISRVLGLVRVMLQGAFLGTSFLSDAFVIAFTIPNLLRRLFAEGTMIASFVPVFTDVKANRSHEETNRFFASFFTLLTIVLIVVVAIGIIISPLIVRIFVPIEKINNIEYIRYTSTLARIMFPYMLLISLAALIQGVLNIHKNFVTPASTPIFFNLSIITISAVAYYLLNIQDERINFAFSIAVIVGGCIQVLYQIPALFRLKYRIYPSFHFKDKDMHRIVMLFLPGIFGVAIFQFNLLVLHFFAKSLGEGRISSIMFASRLNELVLGVFAVSVATVMLPTLSKEIVAKKYDEFKESFVFSLRLVALITIPATVGLFILSEGIISFLFKFGAFSGQSVFLVSITLRYMSLSLFFVASHRITTQSFYSMKDTKTPVIVAAFGLVMNIVLCSIAVEIFNTDIDGIILANSITQSTMFIILFVLLIVKIKENLLQKIFGMYKTIISAAFMGIFVYFMNIRFLNLFLDSKIMLGLVLMLTIFGSIIVYSIANIILGNRDFKQIIALFRKSKG